MESGCKKRCMQNNSVAGVQADGVWLKRSPPRGCINMLAVALSSGDKYELNWEAVRVRTRPTDSELALGRRNDMFLKRRPKDGFHH